MHPSMVLIVYLTPLWSRLR